MENKKHLVHFVVTEELVEKVNDDLIKNKGKHTLKESERIIKIKDMSENEINTIFSKVKK